MIDYTMLCGWKISFPEKWIYEDDTESGQNIFYPPDSDLTIRITPFHAEKQGLAAPIEVMEEAFLRSVPKSAIPSEIKEYELNNFSVKSFENIETQNGNTVFRIMVGYYASGELLSINIFGTSKVECNQALVHLKTLQRDTSIKVVNTDKGDKPEIGRKYYSAEQGKPPIFIQAILHEQKMSAIDFFHITDAYLDWEKKGDDLAVMEPLIALLAKWGDNLIFAFHDTMAEFLYSLDTRKIAQSIYKDKHVSADEFLYIRCVALVNSKRFYNDIINGRRKLKSGLEFESILYAPVFAWASFHGKDAKEYPHFTKFCYETMSNFEGWQL